MRGRKEKKKKSVFKIFLVVISLIVLIVAGIYIALVINGQTPNVLENVVQEIKQEKKKIKIIDEESKTRPIAVMLDNNKNAWPHSAVQDAYVIYEMEVEGGESRLMALFKDKDAKVDKVGPIRSARHYFLNYALEHNAIYTHLGQSPQAERDLKTLKMSDINGQLYDTLKSRNKENTKEFWREKSKVRPHNAYTSLSNITEIAKKNDYPIKDSKVNKVFNYSVDEVNLTIEGSKAADRVGAGYHDKNKNLFTYDAENKVYKKVAKGVPYKDEISGKELTIKNLVILKTTAKPLNDEKGKGRLDVKNVGELEGYYITNGRAISITAKKDSRSSITKYLDEEGNEIKFNDGNTYIMIVPEKEKIEIIADKKTTVKEEEVHQEADKAGDEE